VFYVCHTQTCLGRNLPDGQECLQPGGISGNALIFISHINRRFAGGAHVQCGFQQGRWANAVRSETDDVTKS
jgi:hypothetical protein